MAQDDHFIIASTDVDAALGAPTAIDADEFDRARLDQRWREFCLKADEYVAQNTRPQPQMRQTA